MAPAAPPLDVARADLAPAQQALSKAEQLLARRRRAATIEHERAATLGIATHLASHHEDPADRLVLLTPHRRPAQRATCKGFAQSGEAQSVD